VLSLWVSACALDRAGLGGEGADAGGGGLDAGPAEADGGTATDAGMDAGPLAPVDAGPVARDAGSDAGRDGGPPPRDAGSPDAWVCVPGCTPDGTAAVSCPAGTTTPCARGCTGGACRPALDCPFDSLGPIASGSMRIGLCGQGDDHDHNGVCTDSSADGEDTMVRLTVDRARRIRLELRDVDGRPVDPMLYVRTTCDDPETELACDDDGGALLLDSSLERDFAPGEYFVVVDTFAWRDGATEYVCGEVELVVTPL
jgi:hypothetical protein